MRARIGAPIVVGGHVWGVALVGTSGPEQLPSDSEARIAEFAELVATAIANTAARSQLHASQDELRMLAEQQAALRRVATLVAGGTSPSDLFAVVAEEVTRVVDVPFAIVVRYNADDTATDCASYPPASEISTVGMRWSLEGTNVRSMVRDSSAPARIDDYSQLDGQLANHARRVGYNSSVGVPIVVAGRVWGAMIVSTRDPLPDDTAERLARFTELLATAIANAESRETLARLAEQQAGLRRVATLVARGVEPSEVFDAVADELRRSMDAMTAGLWRFETSGELTLLAGAAADPALLAKWPVGTRTPVEGNTLASTVQRTGRPARMDDYENVTGAVAERVRNVGVRAAVGVPINVDGRLWGLAAVGSVTPGPMPPDTEARMADFADLVTTSIANAATRDELLASRARIVAAADDARRRIERDLHDGAQQRLVALGLELRAAEARMPDDLQPLKEQIAGLVTTATAVSAEVQEISRGLHPAILSKGGLAPAFKTLARRCTVPVDLDVRVDQRLPNSVEVGAYYVVAEALTNAAKHAQASVVEVCAQATGTDLRLVIRDDGIGGAARGKGSGLTGLVDRVEALGGNMTIQSQPGSGTSLLVNIPIESG
jgi:signal transduction histidine kinase